VEVIAEVAARLPEPVQRRAVHLDGVDDLPVLERQDGDDVGVRHPSSLDLERHPGVGDDQILSRQPDVDHAELEALLHRPSVAAGTTLLPLRHGAAEVCDGEPACRRGSVTAVF